MQIYTKDSKLFGDHEKEKIRVSKFFDLMFEQIICHGLECNVELLDNLFKMYTRTSVKIKENA